MEPMNLGSPGGSTPTNTSPFLPSFLLGDINTSTSRNTLSPTKARHLSFSNTSGFVTSPNQEPAKLSFIQSPRFESLKTSSPHISEPPIHNKSFSGPPIQDLFESLKTKTNPLSLSQSNQSQMFRSTFSPDISQPGVNDSFQGRCSFNAPKTASVSDLWITVFGFPQNAIALVLSHFSKCGTIVDKCFPLQNGNWVHLKFSSRMECDKALNYNEKIISNNIMIGVTNCRELNVTDKENRTENLQRVRPLTHVAYKSAQSSTSIVQSPTAPQKSTGFLSKTVDLLLGW